MAAAGSGGGMAEAVQELRLMIRGHWDAAAGAGAALARLVPDTAAAAG